MSLKSPRLVPFVLSVLALSGCYTPHVDLMWPSGKRSPNAHETFYTAVAADFGDAKMCPKIYERAVDESCGPDISCSDWRVAYERSECFFYAALQAKDSKYCDSVESIAVLPSNQSEISKSACMQVIRNGQHYQYQPVPDHYTAGDMMREMGYRQEDIDSLSYARNRINNPAHRFYDTVRENWYFKSRVEALPDYTEPLSEEKLRPANEDELLMQMAAIDDGITRLCGKISPNAYYQLLGSYGPGGRYSLRDACFYYAAERTSSSRLCEPISPKGTSSITNPGMNRQGCENWIRIQELRHLNLGMGDGPVNFPTMNDFVKALQKMGYANPFLRETDRPDWLGFYQFIEISTSPGEKEQFLKRAESLPNFTE